MIETLFFKIENMHTRIKKPNYYKTNRLNLSVIILCTYIEHRTDFVLLIKYTKLINMYGFC